MRRVGKGFSGQVLDKCSILVLRVEGLETGNTAQQLEILKLKARVKKLERLNKGRISVDIDEGIELVDDQEKDAQVKGRQADTQAEIYNINSKVLSMQEDTEVQEVVKVVNAAKIMNEVATIAASISIPAAEPAVVAISAAKPAAKPKVLKIVPAAPAVSTRKRKRVSIQEEEKSHVQAKDVQAKGIQYIGRYHGYKKKPQSESEARKNMIAYLKNTETLGRL
nr:hypothetical protein [Tanacetum cinerariifolium]